jgi:hypothetical protein
MLKRLIGWFKIRYVFSDQQLIDALDLLEYADIRKLPYEKQVKAEKAWRYIADELVRRGYEDYK